MGLESTKSSYWIPRESLPVDACTKRVYSYSQGNFLKAHLGAPLLLITAMACAIISAPVLFIRSGVRFFAVVIDYKEMGRSMSDLAATLKAIAFVTFGSVFVVAGFIAPGRVFLLFKQVEPSSTLPGNDKEKELEKKTAALEKEKSDLKNELDAANQKLNEVKDLPQIKALQNEIEQLKAKLAEKPPQTSQEKVAQLVDGFAIPKNPSNPDESEKIQDLAEIDKIIEELIVLRNIISPEKEDGSSSSELDRLRSENIELRKLVDRIEAARSASSESVVDSDRLKELEKAASDVHSNPDFQRIAQELVNPRWRRQKRSQSVTPPPSGPDSNFTRLSPLSFQHSPRNNRNDSLPFDRLNLSLMLANQSSGSLPNNGLLDNCGVPSDALSQVTKKLVPDAVKHVNRLGAVRDLRGNNTSLPPLTPRKPSSTLGTPRTKTTKVGGETPPISSTQVTPMTTPRGRHTPRSARDIITSPEKLSKKTQDR